MTIQAKILLDSLSPAGARLTTFELTYPRFIHSEFMTHRMVSRNAASSRAIPVEKMIQRVLDDPAMPVFWGKNQSGMQAAEELSDAPLSAESLNPNSPRDDAKRVWLEARDLAVDSVRQLQRIGLHKQIANRIIEPWMHITVIASATHWANFFHLRTHKAAQPEFQALARAMKQVYDDSRPTRLPSWEWHMPLIHEEDWDLARQLAETEIERLSQTERTSEYLITTRDWAKAVLRKVSVGRCARVSYLTHDGVRDLSKDVELHDKLLAGIATDEPLHMSPFEHVARALPRPQRSGNFVGFEQYRKMIQGEAGPPEPNFVEESSL